ncbi:hypothetical protein [Streptomyces sp. NPDC058385]|uniref:hypothetical protein n=1 Tax=Streptomyces sp. NPDC058385 TaxID=3346473 RepID=UPI003667BA86
MHRRFRVEYTLAGLDLLLHRIGWSALPQGRRARRGEDRRLEGRAVARHKKTAARPGRRRPPTLRRCESCRPWVLSTSRRECLVEFAGHHGKVISSSSRRQPGLPA